MYFLWKNEYRIFKPIEITIRRRKKGEKNEKNRGDESIWVIIHIYMAILYKQKCLFTKTKMKVKQVLSRGWHQWEVEECRERV
jgi:hypothetical protein